MADPSDTPQDAGMHPIPGYNYGNGNIGLGSSDTASTQSSFPSSPLFKGEVVGWEQYKNKVLRGRGDIVPGGQDFQFTTPDGRTPSRTFSQNNPPSFQSVVRGPGGAPGSPWTPNTASPDGTTNYSDLPNPPYSPTAVDAVDNYGVGQGGTFSPADSSETQVTLSDYLLGSWG